jgi:hypothetical protein
MLIGPAQFLKHPKHAQRTAFSGSDHLIHARPHLSLSKASVAAQRKQ